MSRKMWESSCRKCSIYCKDSGHGLARLPSCYLCYCKEFVPSDNLEYLEYINEKKSKV